MSNTGSNACLPLKFTPQRLKYRRKQKKKKLKSNTQAHMDESAENLCVCA